MMKRASLLTACLLLLLYGTASAEVPVSADVPSRRYFIAPYAWMMGMSGTMGARGYSTEVDSSFSDALDKVDFAGMLAMEAVFDNRYGVMANLNVVELKDQGSYKGVSLSGGTHMFFGGAALFYRVASRPLKRHPAAYANFDILAGFNYWDVGLELDASSSYLGSRSVSKSARWFDPIFGARMQIRFDEKWTFVLQGHLGEGGDTRSTWDVNARVGYRIGNNSTLMLGYRAVNVNRREGREFTFNTTLHGPMLGVLFYF